MAEDIMQRYLKKTKTYASVVAENKYDIREWISTGNYALNTLISGDPEKGFPSGKIIQFAGPSSTGKSFIAIECVKQAQKAGYRIFYYDTEGAQTPKQLMARGVDGNTCILIPIAIVKETQEDILNLINDVTEKDKVMIVMDSIGNMVTNKEYTDAVEGNNKRDMTRQQELKSLMRTISVPAMIKNIPIILINHTYLTMDLFPQEVTSGGTGPLYNSSAIITLSKSKDIGPDKEPIGAIIRGMSYKNRLGKEKSKASVTISYSRGLTKYSGLFDLAISVGFIDSPKNGWYRINGGEKLLRKADIVNSEELMLKMLNEGLSQKLRNKFSYGVLDAPTETEMLDDDSEEGEGDNDVE